MYRLTNQTQGYDGTSFDYAGKTARSWVKGRHPFVKSTQEQKGLYYNALSISVCVRYLQSQYKTLTTDKEYINKLLQFSHLRNCCAQEFSWCDLIAILLACYAHERMMLVHVLNRWQVSIIALLLLETRMNCNC